MKPSVALLGLALTSLLVAISGGLLSSLYYVPSVYPILKEVGAHMHQSRATHTTFAIAWIYLGAIAVVYSYLEEDSALTRGWRLRAWAHIALWTIAGAGIAASFVMKVFSGREYVEYHPVFSLLIYSGWLMFFMNLISRARRGFWEAPVYIYLWVIGAALFLVTYLEAHLWYLLSLADYSVADMQVQWKSVGTMAGSFNMLVYGSGMYLAEKLTGNTANARSRIAFSLLWIGLLNSFTNYTHHTYTLPQDSPAKWIGFLVSMLEILILFRVVSELAAGRNATQKSDEFAFLRCSKWWTACNLALAVAISIPAVNVIFHGSHVVVAHAMGTTIGIDTFILFGTTVWLVDRASTSKITPLPGLLHIALNTSLGIFLASLLVLGYSNSLSHFFGSSQAAVPWSIAGMCMSGLSLALLIWGLAIRWLACLLRSAAPYRSSAVLGAFPPLDGAVEAFAEAHLAREAKTLPGSRHI